MSLFRRRDKTLTEQTPRRSSSPSPKIQPAWLPGPAEVQVAGESFHLDAIEAAVWGNSSPLAALLIPDPANIHDPYAVAVHISGQHVGFLPRSIARHVQPALRAFSRTHSGRLVACPAEIRWHDVGPQVILWLDPEPLDLHPDVIQTMPDMAASISRLMPRLDEAVPHLNGADMQARAALAAAERQREETEANYDREASDWPRLEKTFRGLARNLATAGDPLVSAAWLGVGRSTRYQRGRRDDALAAFVEALYWDRGNRDAWWELVDLAAAAPHVPTLLALYEHVPFTARPPVLDQLVIMSHGHDRLGNIHLKDGDKLRAGLFERAEAQHDHTTIAVLAGQAGIAAEKAGDLAAAVQWWRHAITAGGTDEKVADRFSIWLAKQHQYAEAVQVLRQALAAKPRSADVAERMRRRLARCEHAAPAQTTD
jgi:tetratricopeptide (TPR) repeat protein